MEIFFIILTVIILLFAINKTNKKIYNRKYKKYKEKLKQIRKRIIILGIISLIIIIIFSLTIGTNNEAEEILKNSVEGNIDAEKTIKNTLLYIYILPFIYIISMVMLIINLFLMPSKEKINNDDKKNKIEQELKKYNFEKQIKYKSNIVKFDNHNRVLAIINTYKNTLSIIKYNEIKACEILENNKCILNTEDRKTTFIYGINSSNPEGNLKLNIICNNINKQIYTIKINNTEKEAYEYLYKIYLEIMNIINY